MKGKLTKKKGLQNRGYLFMADKGRLHKWLLQSLVFCSCLFLPLSGLSFVGRGLKISTKYGELIVDSTYDCVAEPEAKAFLEKYTQKLDSVTQQVIGILGHDMEIRQPECELYNLIGDMMVWAAAQYGDSVDMAFCNEGNVRNSLARGKVRYGDAISVLPFENRLAVLTLDGKNMMKLFETITVWKGVPVSHGVEMKMTAEGKLVSVLLNGKAIDPSRSYRIVTNDYILEGNDNFTMLKNGRDVKIYGETGDEKVIFYNLFAEYIKAVTKQKGVVNVNIEGRIKIAE